jgi:hypothetical protein
MSSHLKSRCRGTPTVLGVILGVVAMASPAFAGGGNVLPPTARPKGNSLADMAVATAAFNVGTRAPDTLPDTAFQVLYILPGQTSNTFDVKTGTMFYVPLTSWDDSPPIIEDFPDVADEEAVENYYFSEEQLGFNYIEIVVDGRVTSVGPEYVVGVETPPLPDGGGTHYTVSAVFLTPLTKGTHTVEIRMFANGDAWAEFPDLFPGGIFEGDGIYTVNVH